MSNMKPTYPKTNWKDFPDTSTPLTADKLNQIEAYLDHAYTISYALNKDWGQTETQVKDLLRYMDDARTRLKDVELNDAETSTKINKMLSDIDTLTKGLETQASLTKDLDRWKTQHSEQFKDLLTGYTELEELAAKTFNDLSLLTAGVNIPSWLQDLRDISSKMELQLNTLLSDFDKLETSHKSLEDSHKVLEEGTEALSELVNDLDEAFSFKGNNLIQNGWDDFEPYGSGKNYVENWNFEDDDMSVWNNQPKTDENTFIVGYSWRAFQKIKLPKGEYVVRFKAKMNKGYTARIAFGGSGKHFNWYASIGDSGVFRVIEQRFTIDEEIEDNFFILANPNSEAEFDWIQVTPVNNQHLVIEKTPLGNGLTRIQTWGGNRLWKLDRGLGRREEGKKITFSSYVKNMSKHNVKFVHTASEQFYVLSPQEEQYITVTGVVEGEGWDSFRIYVDSLDDNLDFIASDPVIVEGEAPGLMEITKDNIAKEVSLARYWNLENLAKVLGLEDKLKEIESKLENPFDEDEKEQIINDVKEENIAAIGDINFDDMENAISILEESLATKASQTELNEALANIEKILETHATKKNLTDSVNKLEVQINELGEGLEAKIKDIVDGSSAEGIEELQGELKELKGRVDALGTVVKDEDFQAALIKLNKDIGSKASKSELNSKVSALENDLSSRVTSAELDTAVTGVKKELDGSITALNVGGLKSSLDQLQKDHAALSSKVNGFNFAKKEDVDALSSGVSDLSSKISPLEGRVTLVEFSLRSFDKTVKELEENVSSLDNTVKGALTSSNFKEVMGLVPGRQGQESSVTVPSGFGPYPHIISVMHTQPNNGGIRVPAGKDFSYWFSSDGKKIHYKSESSDGAGGQVWFLLMKPF